jgi:hypothetical protein
MGAHEHHAHGHGVGKFLLAQLLIKRAQIVALSIAQRATPSLRGEVQRGLHMSGLDFDLQVLEGLRSAHDRLAQRFQSFVAIGRVWPVLRGELPDLLKGIHQREGILADEM